MATAMEGQGQAAARAQGHAHPRADAHSRAHAGCASGALAADARLRIDRSRRIALAALGVAALAWLALYLWSVSRYADWLDHGGWLSLGLAQSLCLWTGEAGAAGVAIGIAAWMLMLAAMMLPTATPLLALVDRAAVRAGRRGPRPVLAAVAGYLALWLGFGLAAHGLDAGLQAIVARTPWLLVHGWSVGAGVIALAGLYQLSPLKESCRSACHAPLREAAMLDAAAMTGRSLDAAAFRAGLAHGVACIGCCWALMLLMFVVGMSNLAWMLALAAVMAVEKNFAIGARLGAPLGVALLLASAVIAGAHL